MALLSVAANAQVGGSSSDTSGPCRPNSQIYGGVAVSQSDTSGTFTNVYVCGYAWQSIASVGGNGVVVPGGAVYTSALITAGNNFSIAFSPPPGAGWTFASPSTMSVTTTPITSGTGTCTAPAHPESATSTLVVFSITVVPGTTGVSCQVQLQQTVINGATALATPNTLCLTYPNSNPNNMGTCPGTPPNAIFICEDVYGSNTTPNISDGSPTSSCKLTTIFALSTSQLGFTTDTGRVDDIAINLGAVTAEQLCLGRGFEQPSYIDSNFSPSNAAAVCNPTAQIGSLDIWSNDYYDYDASYAGGYPLTGTVTVSISGNFTNISTVSCGTVNGTPSAGVVNLVFPVPAPDATSSCLLSVTADGTSIIGANFNGFSGPLPPGVTAPTNVTTNPITPTPSGGYYGSSPLITYASSPATYQAALANVLKSYSYNGILQPINSAFSNANNGVMSIIRVVNNSAQQIQVYADVQGDDGELGTATVENGLPGNTNDYVAVQAIAAAAGVAPTNTHISMTLMVPYPNPFIGGLAADSINPGNGSQGIGPDGFCTPSTNANVGPNGTTTGSYATGLCFVQLDQLAIEAGGIVVNLQ
jgi:hypothetical protein